MSKYLWNVALILLLMLTSSVAAVLAADASPTQTSPAVQEANMISLANAGTLGQIFAAVVVLLLVIMALAPLLLGNEAGAGINIQ